MELLRIHVVLDGVAPTVWRRLDVPRSMTLDRLHLVLQGAMGWTDAHVHEFETVARDGSRHPQRYLPDDALDDGEPGEREATMPVGRLLGRPGDLLRYLYDAGDAWTHTLRLEQVVPALDAGPRCLGGGRACPPEDCGGPTGYDRLLRVLAGERRRDAERFDVARAQAAIARLLQEHPVRATVGPVGDPTSRPGVPEEPQGGSRPGASDPSGPVDAMLLRATRHRPQSLAEHVRRAP
ncbi:MAG: plasmid pRiA4b ORF-3 family protein, partial [Actinotalea sp.]|nr:plasmid pRiA4b ORF-3 family protein [Actinotalea sp.]